MEVELSSVDLNLLVALRALLAERHVSRAAARLGLSQPATSRALSRLRDLFGDELLVREGQAMELTQRARELIEPLEGVLAGVSQLLAPPEFDPMQARGRLRIAMPDIVAYGLLGPLMRHLAEHAPHLDIDVHQWDVDWRRQLHDGACDITFGQPRGDEASLFARVLAKNTWACAVRRGHPALSAEGAMDLQTYVEQAHLLIGFTPRGGGHVDSALERLGERRRVGLRMPYVTLSPLVVADSDLVLTTARWLAERAASLVPLTLFEPPIELEPVELTMVWHERTHADPRLAWFRGVLEQISRAEGLVAESGSRSRPE